MCEIKSNKKADALRAEGNKFYSERKFHDAVLKYNESLCYAEPETENIGLAYANRSAVFFEMKLFEKCLKNVELAKSQKYPEKNLETLKKREEKCRELMKSSNESLTSDPRKLFKLSYPPNKRLPFIIACLELKVDEVFGRHIITNRSLKVGDIVSIEEPFCSVLLSQSNFVEVPKSNIFQRCANCLKDNGLDLMPCGRCCQGKLLKFLICFICFP